MSVKTPIPPTPRVISPSPTPSEQAGRDGYFAPTTRSKTVSARVASPSVEEHASNGVAPEEDADLKRARSRSRSPILERGITPLTTTTNGAVTTSAKADTTSTASSQPSRRKPSEKVDSKAETNGLLSPASAHPEGQGFGSSYWRNLSRSPSPLGLIPAHSKWRAFIHKHEVPRKVLHTSIGFITLWLYFQGAQTSHIHPVLLSALIPVTLLDVIRFNWPAFNELYIKAMGSLMRESEAHDRYNGVISYLAGVWATMYFCRKDVAVMSVLLLSWSDTAASTFGRLWGKYTPRIRKGKSLAGSLAAFATGVFSAVLFWGIIAPKRPAHLNQGVNSFAFDGRLTLPSQIREQFGWSLEQTTISGQLALTVLSFVTGLIVSVSEAADIFDLDDNLTIPVLSGFGLAVFLRAFGESQFL